MQVPRSHGISGTTAAAGVGSAKLRKDLSHLGSYGTRGVGYDVAYLLHQIRRELGLTQHWPIVIAGIAIASGTEPDIGPIAAAYVLLLAIVGPLLARLADRSAAAPARTAAAGEALDGEDLR